MLSVNISLILYACLLFQNVLSASKIVSISNSSVQQAGEEKIENELKTLENSVTQLRNLINGRELLYNIAEAIENEHFSHAEQLIQNNHQHLTSKCWDFIVQKLTSVDVDASLSRKLVQFAITKNFDTSKLMLYLKLQKISSEKCAIQFSAFKKQIVKTLEDLLLKSFGANETVATKSLEEIDWDKLVVSELADSDELSMQKFIKEAVRRIYSELDVNKFLDQIQNIKTHLEKNKIYKVYLYGAVQYAISTEGNNDSRYLFKLAFNIQHYLAESYHKTGAEYFDQYLNNLIQNFHGCIRNIVFLSKSNEFQFRNVKYNEYMYIVHTQQQEIHAQLPNGWFDFLVFSRFTNWMDPMSRFYLEFVKNRFLIRSAAQPTKYVDTFNRELVTLANIGDRRIVGKTFEKRIFQRQLESTTVDILPSSEDEENCYIRNFHNERYMYAGADDADKQRVIYSNGVFEKRDSSYMWNITPYRVFIN